MKLLLLTDMPPCRNYTGGMVLAQMCKLLPPGSVACFCILDTDLQNIEPDPDLASLPLEYAAKPCEDGLAGGRFSREVQSFIIERARQWVATPELLRAAVSFARRQGVDAVWAVLEGQTLVRLTRRLAEQLKMPLYILVWDPLVWWLNAHRVDRWHSKATFAEFDRVLRSCKACATASPEMAREYERRYGVRSIPVIASCDSSWAQSPAAKLHNDSSLVIGMAGQFYAVTEWQALIRCLNQVQWEIAGRQVQLLVLGHYMPDSGIPAGRCNFLGWRPQREAIEILAAQADVLFCPYPFAPHMAEVARLSFPGKLVTYFAAGRPVLFHGPQTSSPARYLSEHAAGLITAGSGVPNIFNALHALVSNPSYYAAFAVKSQEAFAADFTLEQMHLRILQFLDVSDEELMAAPPAPVPFDPTAPAARIPPPRIRRAGWRRVAHGLLGVASRTPARPAADAFARAARWYVRRRGRYAALCEALERMRREHAELIASHDLERRELIASHDLERSNWKLAEAAMRQQHEGVKREHGELIASHELERRDWKLAEAVNQERLAGAHRAYDTLLAAHITLDGRFEKVASAGLGKMSLIDDRLRGLMQRLEQESGTGPAKDSSQYLDLLEAVLTGSVLADPSISPWVPPGFSPEVRMLGRDWPERALTMIGTVRMRNLRNLVETVLHDEIPGDLIETGVWRGGACIYMRAILAAHGVKDRTVWLADSFEGLPPPDAEEFPADAGDTHHTQAKLAVSADEVRAAFERFELLDGQVRFLEGWFKDTLPEAPIDTIALLRLDGDMYESTWEALLALHPKVSPGGFIIIDDYILQGCRAAVDAYRAEYGIMAPLQEVDGAAVYWRKPGS